ncbi:monooxygenase [Penicillium cosmopolitanum]|uniref:Monooxygenase n=1 Tax=Penicillium cosmopolitanum TaxID=1131564 RepID=A0A9X0BE29_9EURO|nr:monooxygenase [Penicillium cosmopolitanum]KAJ5413628.1 monooxygenase [Penicillium cosmopolitanum]
MLEWRNTDRHALRKLIQYYRRFAEHYRLPQVTTFGQNVVKATWSAEKSLWVVDLEDVHSGSRARWTCRVLIQAAGTYNRKSVPNYPGMHLFKGEMWHASDWPENYYFAGKSVAYVGTGPTSVQVLPYIQAQAKEVSVFCRSMTYCHPFTNIKYPGWVKWAFRWIPGLLALYSLIVASLFAPWAYFAFRPETWLARYTEHYCRRVLEKQVPDPDLRKKLSPTGRFGSKRPLVSLSGFFDVLQKENVNVVSNPIMAVDEAGITTETPMTNDAVIQIDDADSSVSSVSTERPKVGGTHIKADVIIWGTGFQMQGWGGAVPTLGREGKLLSEHWKDSPKTLFGTYTLHLHPWSPR